jgi:hypothetical protein
MVCAADLNNKASSMEGGSRKLRSGDKAGVIFTVPSNNGIYPIALSVPLTILMQYIAGYCRSWAASYMLHP